jgi:hypothetical protein
MSTQLKRFVKIRLLVMLFTLAMILVSLVAAPPSKVRVRAEGDELHIAYYTDATHSTQCGYTIILCSGYRAHGGCTTAYYTESTFPCECDVQPC